MSILPIPFARFDLYTALPPGEALARLSASIERDWRRWWFGRIGRPFVGHVEADSFSLQRIIHYRNSFLPRIRGHVVATPLGGSRVVGTMSLHPLVGAFLVVVCLWVLCASLFAPWQTDLERVMAPVLVIGVCYTLSTAAFVFEAAKAHRLLTEMVEAKEKPFLPEALDA